MNLLPALRASRCRQHDGLAAGYSQDANVQKTANDQSEQERKDRDKRFRGHVSILHERVATLNPPLVDRARPLTRAQGQGFTAGKLSLSGFIRGGASTFAFER